MRQEDGQSLWVNTDGPRLRVSYQERRKEVQERRKEPLDFLTAATANLGVRLKKIETDLTAMDLRLQALQNAMMDALQRLSVVEYDWMDGNQHKKTAPPTIERIKEQRKEKLQRWRDEMLEKALQDVHAHTAAQGELLGMGHPGTMARDQGRPQALSRYDDDGKPCNGSFYEYVTSSVFPLGQWLVIEYVNGKRLCSRLALSEELFEWPTEHWDGPGGIKEGSVRKNDGVALTSVSHAEARASNAQRQP